mmetsp:Transcript_24626/g.77428  ORF Transcript_24626/g.77428 Transcript_24626/m.77428 type:complete len:270 (-) Transcript_24626:533-1342(-)
MLARNAPLPSSFWHSATCCCSSRTLTERSRPRAARSVPRREWQAAAWATSSAISSASMVAWPGRPMKPQATSAKRCGSSILGARGCGEVSLSHAAGRTSARREPARRAAGSCTQRCATVPRRLAPCCKCTQSGCLPRTRWTGAPASRSRRRNSRSSGSSMKGTHVGTCCRPASRLCCSFWRLLRRAMSSCERRPSARATLTSSSSLPSPSPLSWPKSLASPSSVSLPGPSASPPLPPACSPSTFAGLAPAAGRTSSFSRNGNFAAKHRS